MDTKRTLLSLLFFLSGFGFIFAQDSVTAPENMKKPLSRAAFESGIFIDNQTVALPPAKTLEFVLQHRFGTIQNGWKDLAGLWGASNIRLGLNFTITKNLMVGLGTTKNNMLQDLQVKYIFLRQRDKGFPLTIGYYGDLSLNASGREIYGTDYKFVDRLAWYHEFMFSRRFCNYFSAQLGLSYTHFNRVDSASMHDALALALLLRFKVSPQSSIMVTYQQPFIINYDPAFIVRYPNRWIDAYLNPSKSPYPNFGLGWEICTSTHAFQLFLSAAPGIVPSEIVMHNPNNAFNGYILLGLNITRLWSF